MPLNFSRCGPLRNYLSVRSRINRYAFGNESHQKLHRSYIKPFTPEQEYKDTANVWKRYSENYRLDHVKHDLLFKVPEKFKKFEEGFNKVVDFDQQLASMKTRGFYRAYKAFTPPENIHEIVLTAAKDILNITEQNADLRKIPLGSQENKFKLLNHLATKLNHAVPNSLLHRINSVEKVLQFYRAQVSDTNPYEKLEIKQRNNELPPNLHIQLDPVRFNSEGTHKFDQVTAFPGSRTIINDPEVKKKYKHDPIKRDPYMDNLRSNEFI